MLELTAYGIKVRFGFGFFAAVFFYSRLFDGEICALTAALSACFLHEIGHLAVMLFLGVRPPAVCLYAGGMKIVPPCRIISRGKQAAILSAGCGVNLALAGVSCIIGAETLLRVHLSAGLLNLLPFSALDGGRLMELFLPEGVRRAAAAVTVLLIVLGVMAAGAQPAALMILIFAAAAEFLM